MTLLAAEQVGQFVDLQASLGAKACNLSRKQSICHGQWFAQCELPGNRKVRNVRNDQGMAPGDSSHMRKQTTKPKEPRWFAKEWLKASGKKQADVVAATGRSKSEVSEWVNGGRRYNADVLADFARVIGCDPGDLLRDPAQSAQAEARLIGKVGAGAEIRRLEHPDVLEGISLPRGMDAPNAAEIEGDSQYPLKSGWIILYGPETPGVPEKCLGELCVVQVKDGPTLLKTVRPGNKKGLYRLESWNAQPREDARLEWAALVMDIRIWR